MYCTPPKHNHALVLSSNLAYLIIRAVASDDISNELGLTGRHEVGLARPRLRGYGLQLWRERHTKNFHTLNIHDDVSCCSKEHTRTLCTYCNFISYLSPYLLLA